MKGNINKKDKKEKIEYQDIYELKDKFINFKDREFRKQQIEILNFIEQSSAKVICIQAGCGVGKSLVGMVSGAMYQDCCYLVSSKQLQDQLEHDFPEAKILKGRSNYACRNRKGRTCAECVHTKVLPCGYDTNKSCKYKTQKSDVEKAKFRILNYHYFLHEANHVGKFSDFSVIIADEADMIESLLTDFVGLNISGSRLKELRIDPPKNKTSKAKNGVENWKKWAEIAIKKTQNKRGLIDQYLKRKDISKIEIEDYKKESAKLVSLIKNLTTFYHNVNESWILEIIKPDKYNKFKFPVYKFKPIWLTQHLAKQFFWNHANKFVLMSATFPPKKILSETLGLEEWEIDFLDVPSSFPVENRPVILRPVGNLIYKSFDEEVKKVLDEILNICEQHINEKGLIHAVSYKLTQLIIEAGQRQYGSDSRFITHTAKDRESILQTFKESNMNDILVSPSMERGVDLPGNECTFQIIAKCPFKSLGDKLTSARVYSGSLGAMWYRSLTSQVIVQAAGRPVRSETDKAITYCLDQQITDLISGNKWLFPKYFIESLDF